MRVVRLSILIARFSLSAVSSSTEELAVLASAPRFLRRSITSWLERFTFLASWKTLTLPIRLPLLARLLRRPCLGHRHRLARLALGGSGRRLLGRESGLLGRALRLDAGVLLRVPRVPVHLGQGRRLADLLG